MKRLDNKELLEQCWKIPGWFSPDEYAAFHKGKALLHENSIREGDIVELGTWAGRSTGLLAILFNLFKIHTYDCYFKYPEGFIRTTDLDNVNKNPKAVADVHLPQFDNVYRHYIDSSLGGKLWGKDRKVTILFVDASHETDNVLDDIESWLPRMSDKSIVYFHDAVNAEPHSSKIQKAISESSLTLRGYKRDENLEGDSLMTFKKGLAHE